MEILVATAIVAILFLTYQARKTIKINKLSLGPFPAWVAKYVHLPQTSVDKATLSKSLILQILIISKDMSAFRNEDYRQIESELKKLGPAESTQFVEGWLEQHLPTVEKLVGSSFIEKCSARFVFMLMLIAATSVNPNRSLREFLDRQRSSRPI